MSAIKAEYVNLKHVKSRDAYQIILEVPAESAMNVIDVLGLPASHVSKYVGVALLAEPEPAPEEPISPFEGG